MIVSFVLEAFYAAFSAVVAAVFYYELRVAKDGVDIHKIAGVFVGSRVHCLKARGSAGDTTASDWALRRDLPRPLRGHSC